jgi:serine/threonine protein kinase
MHECSYVHRDISTGNILFHNGQGKLSDLEYAKEITATEDAYEVRTVCSINPSSASAILTFPQGVAYFMAIEVATQKYLFEPDEDLDLNAPAPLFQYNPLHDIESIWWITNYFLFRHFTEANHDRQDLDKDAHTLFPSNNETSGRNHAFTTPRFYNGMLLHLPDSFQTHGRKMNSCRHKLCMRYKEAESGDGIQESAFDGTIHDFFTDTFAEFINSYIAEQAVVATPQVTSREREENEEVGEEARPSKKRKVGTF